MGPPQTKVRHFHNWELIPIALIAESRGLFTPGARLSWWHRLSLRCGRNLHNPTMIPPADILAATYICWKLDRPLERISSGFFCHSLFLARISQQCYKHLRPAFAHCLQISNYNARASAHLLHFRMIVLDDASHCKIIGPTPETENSSISYFTCTHVKTSFCCWHSPFSSKFPFLPLLHFHAPKGMHGYLHACTASPKWIIN